MRNSSQPFFCSVSFTCGFGRWISTFACQHTINFHRNTPSFETIKNMYRVIVKFVEIYSHTKRAKQLAQIRFFFLGFKQHIHLLLCPQGSAACTRSPSQWMVSSVLQWRPCPAEAGQWHVLPVSCMDSESASPGQGETSLLIFVNFRFWVSCFITGTNCGRWPGGACLDCYH